MTPWLTIVGIGAEGLSSVSAAGRDAIAQAGLLVGGERHQEMIAESDVAEGVERMTWHCGIRETAERLADWRGKPVCVLVTGDPMNFGAGATLARYFDADEMTVLPHPGAFSLACARMVWSLPDVTTMTVHGRALAAINLHVRPAARIVAPSWNGETPAKLADILTARGFGPSRISVLANMGAEDEARFDGTADDWPHGTVPDLNTVCIECIPGRDAAWWPRTPGLPEEAYVHDGQITKREIRAVTLATLGPQPGETLWDIGAGSGSVAIEWLRAVDGTQAVGFERNASRIENMRVNAETLGVPRLRIVEGTVPGSLDDEDSSPDAIFIGGGLLEEGLLDNAFDALKPGGRMVANAVTVEGQAVLSLWGQAKGATMSRLAAARADDVGQRSAFRSMMEVLQMHVGKQE